MTIETDEDLAELRIIGRIVARCLDHMAEAMEPGMTTRELDDIGSVFLDAHGARSAPKLTYAFPGTTCISVNEQVAHGIPGSLILREGDLVNIDVSAERNGYFADTGGSFSVGAPTTVQRTVCESTKEALAAAMSVAKSGAAISDVGRAVERVAKRRRLKIIRDLCSHGVGRALHEEPGLIPSHFDPRDRRRFAKGQVITLEPFLTTGDGRIVEGEDGWTLSTTTKGAVSAQFEHTMVLTNGAPIVLTL